MNNQTKNLLEKINNKLKTNPLIYFAKDAERATGLEDYLKNYSIVAGEQSEIAKNLAQKLPVFISESPNFSMLNILENNSLLEFIKKQSNNTKFFAQFFQLTTPYINKINSINGVVLNNNPSLNRKFEDKFTQLNIFKENNIKHPKSIIVDLVNLEFNDICKELKSKKLVIQMNRAHTGMGTYFVNSIEDWNLIYNKLKGNTVKISAQIEGDSYTINGCITKYGNFIAGLQYQITGIAQISFGKGTTVGNDFSFANNLSLKTKEHIYQEVKKIANILQKSEFKGLFGIDLIISESQEIFIIEINARQTANIPFQTKLEILSDITPLSLISLAEFLEIDFSIENPKEILPLNGAQIFLRSKTDDFKVNNQLKTGIYRLQSDNSAIDWQTLQIKDNVIFIDENKDMPLILNKNGYSIMDIDKKNGGFVLITQSKNTIKNLSDELARMQFKEGIILPNKVVKPWILQALVEIENLIK